MIPHAKVASVEALESFRASLIVYLSKARPALEEISAEVMRTRLWLQNDRRIHWEDQVRRRTRELEEARQALFSARLSHLRDATAAEHLAVQRAKRALEEAETRLGTVRRWSREFDSRVGPPVKQLEPLRAALTTDLPRAVAFLGQAVRTLDAYAGVSLAPAATSSAPPPATDAPGETASPPGKA